jgi:hypothetical protein
MRQNTSQDACGQQGPADSRGHKDGARQAADLQCRHTRRVCSGPPAVVIPTRSPYVIQCIDTYVCGNEVSMYVAVRVEFCVKCYMQSQGNRVAMQQAQTRARRTSGPELI